MRITSLGVIVACILSVSLSGCGYSLEETKVKNEVIKSNLPKNCEINYFGEYYVPTGSSRPLLIIPVVAVQCDGKQVTTVNSTLSAKGNLQQAIVLMEDRESDFVMQDLKRQESLIKKRIIFKKIQDKLPLSDEELEIVNTWYE